MPVTPIGLARLARAFVWIGLTALGGGRSAYFHDAVVVRRGWLSSREFLQDFTLCQLLPGPNFSNLAVAIGHRLAGRKGALAAGLAVLVPGALVLLAVSALYGGGGLAPGARHFVRGMGAAVVGLVLMTAVRLTRGAVHGRSAALIAALTFLAVGPLRINTLLVIVVTAAAGLWLNRPGATPAAPPAP